MEDFATIMSTTWSYFMTPITIMGITISYGLVYLYIILSAAVIAALKFFFFD